MLNIKKPTGNRIFRLMKTFTESEDDMQTENKTVRYAEKIAAEVWREMGRSNLADPEKMGAVPQVRIRRLDAGLNGLAWPDRIELNADRLEDSDEEAFLQEVIRHELAHVAEYRLTGIMGHGPLWHALCRSAGGKANSRDSFDDPFAGADSGLIMFPAVLESAVLFSWGTSALHCPLWCAIAAGFAGFLFPPVCWAVFCRTEKTLHFTAMVFTAVETVLLLALLCWKH